MSDGGNVTIFGDVADRYDALVQYDERWIDRLVEEDGYSTGAMVLGSVVKSVLQFSQSFVDVGRLGNGVFIEGGWRGVGKDVLRALTFTGAVGSGLARAGRLLRQVQVGNTCAWFAQGNAIHLAGHRYFMTVRELARRAGLTDEVWASIQESGRLLDDYLRIQQLLTRLGITNRLLTLSNRTFPELFAAVRANAGGVVTFSVRFGQFGHRLYATYTRTAGLVIRDPNFHFRVYRSIADLERAFGKGVTLSASPLIFVKDALLLQAAAIADAVGGLGGVALQVLPLVSVPAKDAETAAQTLHVRDTPPLPSAGAPRSHTVVAGDTLWALARRYYGRPEKWPLLYAANRGVIGANPDLILVGQRLFVPDAPRLTRGP